MNLLHIASSVVWIDFLFLMISKFYQMTTSLDVWYKQFGIVAVISDCLVIVLGILIAQFISPNASVTGLAITSVIVQLIHDVLFYVGVILPIPKGHNQVIDLFKRYSNQGGVGILVADSAMIGGTVFLADYLKQFNDKIVTLVGLLGAYAITYGIYTN
jgi:uncharacterized protein YacL